jgi:hypothetical protein
MLLPAEVAGVVALDELVVHGWDLSVATGRAYDPPAHEVGAALSFVASFDAPRDGLAPRPPARSDRPRSPVVAVFLSGRRCSLGDAAGSPAP